MTVGGQIDFAHAAATAAVTLPANFPIGALAGTTENVVLVGGTIYLSVPTSLQGYVGGAQWVYVALPSSIDSAIGTLGNTLADWCGNGQSLVTLLGTHGVSTSSLGSSTTGGVTVSGRELKTTGRRLTKLSKAARHVDRSLPAVNGRTPVTVDLWTNSAGQLTQLTADLGSFTVTLSLTNINQPVSITAPAGAVMLPSSVLGLLGGFLSAQR